MGKLAQSKAIKKPERKRGSEGKAYTKFMFEDVIYHVGEYVLFRETDKTNIVG